MVSIDNKPDLYTVRLNIYIFLCCLSDRIKDTDCFLGIHDRKLYVLGICRAISLGGDKPYVLGEVADEILPSLLLIFEGLKRAYQSRAQEGEEEESDEEEDGEDCEGILFGND